MEDRQVRNKALVIGLSQISNKGFLNSTLDLLKDFYKIANYSEPEDLIKSKNDLETFETSLVLNLPLRLENKYYTVDLNIWCDVNLLTNTDIEGYKNLVENYFQIGEVVDAVIFIYDPLVDTKILKDWISFLENFEPNVTLCLIVKPNELKTEEVDVITKMSEKIVEFCNSNGIEPINFNDEENEGLERVFEALQANQWDGLVMKGSDKEDKSSRPTDNTTTASELNRELLPDFDSELPSTSEIESMQKLIFGSSSNGIMDLNDQSLQIVQQLRESASTMSDKDRRSLAAKVALSFSMQLDNNIED